MNLSTDVSRREFFNQLEYTDWQMPMSPNYPVIVNRHEFRNTLSVEDVLRFDRMMRSTVLLEDSAYESLRIKFDLWVENWEQNHADEIQAWEQEHEIYYVSASESIGQINKVGTVLKMRDGAYLLIGDISTELDFMEFGMRDEEAPDAAYTIIDVVGYASLWSQE